MAITKAQAIGKITYLISELINSERVTEIFNMMDKVPDEMEQWEMCSMACDNESDWLLELTTK